MIGNDMAHGHDSDRRFVAVGLVSAGELPV